MQGNHPNFPATPPAPVSSSASSPPRGSASATRPGERTGPNPYLPESVESSLEQGVTFVRECVRKHPEAAALWCLGIGFVLGWKLKPW